MLVSSRSLFTKKFAPFLSICLNRKFVPNSKLEFSKLFHLRNFSFFERSDYVLNALEPYLSAGKEVITNPPQNFKLLNEIIQNYSKSSSLKDILQSEEYKNAGSINNFYIALAIPSMTGKTQAAFCIYSKRPLYFTFSSTQTIYQNFERISIELQLALGYDRFEIQNYLDKLRKSFPDIITDNNPRISHELISNFLQEIKFKSLGFISSLILDAEKSFDGQPNDWMRFLANYEDSILNDFEPMSLKDFSSHETLPGLLASKYCVFLDEFFENSGLIFFRNLCRYLQVPCIVASTNSKITSFVENKELQEPEEKQPDVWCITFPFLANFRAEEVEKKINESIDLDHLFEIAGNVSKLEQSRMKELINYFKIQSTKTRPGMANIIFKSLSEVSTSIKDLNSITVDDFFIKLMYCIYLKLSIRKNLAFSTKDGARSNSALFSGTYFDSKYGSISSGHKFSDNIDSHFFYMKNPRNCSDPHDPFILFKKTLKGEPYISHNVIGDEFSVQSHFEEEEEIVKLTCLIGDLNFSATERFSIGDKRSDIPMIQNPNSPTNLGIILENIILSSILDSSHFDSSNLDGTFKGVTLKEFLRNMSVNLRKFVIGSRLQYSRCFKFNCPENEKVFMGDSIVPCLYIANKDWPEDFKNIFKEDQSTFKLGTYRQTSSDKQVDGRIDVIKSNGEKSFGVVECKKSINPIKFSDYIEIFTKTFKTGAPLIHFLISESVVNLNVQKFKEKFAHRKINFFRIKQDEQYVFDLTPIFPRNLHSEPEMVAFIFETNEINKFLVKNRFCN